MYHKLKVRRVSITNGHSFFFIYVLKYWRDSYDLTFTLSMKMV